MAAAAQSQPDPSPDHGNAPPTTGHPAASTVTTGADQSHIAATEAAASHPGAEPAAPAAADSGAGQDSTQDGIDITQALNQATKTDHHDFAASTDHAADAGVLFLHTEGPPADWPGDLVPAAADHIATDGLVGAEVHGAAHDLSIF